MKPKIIRDKYSEIISNDQLRNVYVDSQEYFDLLIEKLDEETKELADSDYADKNEFADVMEVLFAIAHYKGFSDREIQQAMHAKNLDKGCFSSGLVLDKN